MSLRRGFKAEANRISLYLRRGLGLTPEAPINLEALARHLRVSHQIEAIIVALSVFRDEYPDAVRQLSVLDPGAFSAATVPCGPQQYAIVYNDSHDEGRQQNSIAHEIAHLVLKHPFTLPIDNYGCRNIDRDIEEEANWLGPTILISDEAALHIVKSGMTTDAARLKYGVSEPLLRMRINASGARIRLARAYH
jgi:hypothetical protein